VGLRRVGVLAAVQPGALAADIGDLHQYVPPKLALDSEIPVLYVGVLKARRHVVRPWRELPWARILNEVSDKGLARGRAILQETETLLVFLHVGKILERILRDIGGHGVEKDAVAPSDHRSSR